MGGPESPNINSRWQTAAILNFPQNAITQQSVEFDLTAIIRSLLQALAQNLTWRLKLMPRKEFTFRSAVTILKFSLLAISRSQLHIFAPNLLQ